MWIIFIIYKKLKKHPLIIMGHVLNRYRFVETKYLYNEKN